MKERYTDIHQRILRVIGIDGKKLDRSSYKLQNGKIVMLRYSKPYIRGDLLDYWFGLSKEKFERYSSESFFVLFICGSDDQVLVIPSSYLSELLRDVGTAIDNYWKLHIFKRENVFEISVTGKPDEDVSKYLNKYELLVEETENVPKTPASDIEDKIMSLDGVQGNLHDKLADMVGQIGEWMGYKSIRNYRVRPDAPYLDVAWLLNDAIHIAIEVQIGKIRGNLTEVKDRLILAKRFGARKCITEPESVERIRSLFRYETEIKHWIEIWGLERIYIMFVCGRIFFENFNEFNRHQYRDDIVFV